MNSTLAKDVLELLERHITTADGGRLARVSRKNKIRDLRPCGIRFKDGETQFVARSCKDDWGKEPPLFELGTDSSTTKAQLLCLLRDCHDWIAPYNKYLVGQVEVSGYIMFHLRNHPNIDCSQEESLKSLMQASVNLGNEIDCMFNAVGQNRSTQSKILLNLQFIQSNPCLFLTLMRSTNAFSNISGLQLSGPTNGNTIVPIENSDRHAKFWEFVDTVLSKLTKVDSLVVSHGVHDDFVKSLLRSLHFERLKMLVLGYGNFMKDTILDIFKNGLHSLHTVAISFQGIHGPLHLEVIESIRLLLANESEPISIKHIEIRSVRDFKLQSHEVSSFKKDMRKRGISIICMES